MSSGRQIGSQVLHADLAAADAREQLAGLERLTSGRAVEVLLGGREPEAVLIGEVVARALGAVALDERRGAEVLQARARRHQRLATALASRCSVLCVGLREERES